MSAEDEWYECTICAVFGIKTLAKFLWARMIEGDVIAVDTLCEEHAKTYY